jgi:hypothetical protein
MDADATPTYDSVWAPGTTSGAREYWFIIDQDYTPTAKAWYTGKTVNDFGALPVLYAGWVVAPAQAYKAGDKILIHASVALGADDKWTFTTDGRQLVRSEDQKKSDMDRITVFPNPYYAVNSAETNRFARFVQFTNMPTEATIRIFNLAGHLVRTLHKNDAATFFKWDLVNEVNYPVASGMYIAYIEVPNVGTKVLKMAVIQEQEILDQY